MMRWINWIEEHMDGFFKLNGFLWLICIIIEMAMLFYLLGWPKNSMANWSDFQWYAFKLNMTYGFIDLLICILFFARKYFIFPVVVIYLLRHLPVYLLVLGQVFEGNLASLHANLLGLAFDQILFIPAILGTIIWARKVYFGFDKK